MPGTWACPTEARPSGETSAACWQLRREQLRLEPDDGGRLGHLAEDPLPHRRVSRGLLERSGVEAGDAVEVVLALHVRLRGGAHPRGRLRIGQPLERRRQRGDLLVAADGHLQRHLVRQLGEPADVADDERLPERQRPDRAARRLPHRRRAQQHAGVARGHQRPEPVLLDVRLADHALAVEPGALEPAGEVEAGRLQADEEQPRAGVGAAELGERAQELRNPLALGDVPEAADQRRAVDGRRLDPRRGPGRVRDPPERSLVAVVAGLLLDVVRVDDQPRRAVEHLARERKLLRPHLPQRRHAPFEHAVAEQPPRHACLALHRGEIRVAVLAPDRQPRDEMVDDPVVEDDDTGLPPQGVDDPAVRVRVVADVVERHVRAADRPRPARPHDLDVDEPLERRQQQRRVVGDARRVRRQR